MAKKHSTVAKRSDIPSDNTERRHDIALEAIWQIASLFDALAERGRLLLDADNIDHAAIINALSLRGVALTSAAMSALGEPGSNCPLDEMERAVRHG